MHPPAAITAAESRVIEANAVALGVGLDALMDNAGRAVAEEVLRRLPGPNRNVAILVGPGNNGGDGAAAAHFLREFGIVPRVFEVVPSLRRSGVGQRALERARREGEVREGSPSADELRECALVVDALLGVGHSAPLRPAVRVAVEAAVFSGVPILAIDTPTGLGDPAGLCARWTVALTAPKAEVPEERAGETIVRDIGIPPAAWEETGPGDFLRFDAGPSQGPGARGGRVVVVGGGPYTGAPALVGLAALRCGAERATVLAPEAAASVVRTLSADLVVRGIGRTHFAPEFVDDTIRAIAAGPVGAVVLGSGAGADPATIAYFRAVLKALDPALPVVVDADALAALDPVAAGASPRRIVATPNLGEYRRLVARLLPGADPVAPTTLRALARTLGVTIVRKGAVDGLDDGVTEARNRHHPPELAVAGAGDVLAGVLGALLGRGLDPLGAARLGTYWVGAAGFRTAAIEGPGLLASDLLAQLGPAGLEGLARLRSSE